MIWDVKHIEQNAKTFNEPRSKIAQSAQNHYKCSSEVHKVGLFCEDPFVIFVLFCNLINFFFSIVATVNITVQILWRSTMPVENMEYSDDEVSVFVSPVFLCLFWKT